MSKGLFQLWYEIFNNKDGSSPIDVSIEETVFVVESDEGVYLKVLGPSI